MQRRTDESRVMCGGGLDTWREWRSRAVSEEDNGIRCEVERMARIGWMDSVKRVLNEREMSVEQGRIKIMRDGSE